MIIAAEILGIIAILTNGLVYGTEYFAAAVQRSALQHVDDRALTSVMGYVHHYAGQRLSPPGTIGLLTAIAATVLAAVEGNRTAYVAGGVAVAALLAWLAVFSTVTKPLDKQFAAAALAGEQLPGVRALQRRWDSVIFCQVAFQGVALLGLCLLAVAVH